MRRVSYAARITGIEERVSDDLSQHFYTLLTNDTEMPGIHVLRGYIEKHEPKVGGYYLRYDDGAESYSPWKPHVEVTEETGPEQADEGYRGAPPTEPGPEKPSALGGLLTGNVGPWDFQAPMPTAHAPLAFQALSLAHNPHDTPEDVIERAHKYLAFLRDPDLANASREVMAASVTVAPDDRRMDNHLRAMGVL